MRRMLFVVVAALLFAACTAAGAPSAAVTSPVFTTPPGMFPTTFASQIYGYTIGVGADWTVAPATILADDPTSTEATGTDVITVTGTDTTIQTVVSDLGGQTFGAWLKDSWTAMKPNVPPGCDGGDPSTWSAVTVGDHQGVWQEKCNAAVAIVEVAGKAYQFAWENSTFSADQHLPEAAFKAALRTVAFPQPAASSSPAS